MSDWLKQSHKKDSGSSTEEIGELLTTLKASVNELKRGTSSFWDFWNNLLKPFSHKTKKSEICDSRSSELEAEVSRSENAPSIAPSMICYKALNATLLITKDRGPLERKFSGFPSLWKHIFARADEYKQGYISLSNLKEIHQNEGVRWKRKKNECGQYWKKSSPNQRLRSFFLFFWSYKVFHHF